MISVVLATLMIVGLCLPLFMSSRVDANHDLTKFPDYGTTAQIPTKSPRITPDSSESASHQPRGRIDTAPATTGPYWSNLTTARSPPDLDGGPGSMTYDWADHYDVLFGGYSPPYVNTTWIYTNGSWTNITSSAGDAPPSGDNGVLMTYDWHDGYVFAWVAPQCADICSNASSFVNQTWAFSHGKWSRILATVDAPAVGWQGWIPKVEASSMAYDPGTSSIVLLGGSPIDLESGTWEYSSGVWHPICVSSTNCDSSIPGPESGAPIADDADHGLLVAVSGANRSASTWEFSGGVWSNVTSSTGAPFPPRSSFSIVYDNLTGSVLLFGGQNADQTSVWLNDTWSFNGVTWTNVTTGLAPPRASYSYWAMAYDSTDSGVVVFGSNRYTWMWSSSPPEANLSIEASSLSPIPGSNVSFAPSFEGGVAPYTFSWKFGDGGSSMLEYPSHAFTDVGIYDVKLWLNDSDGHTANASSRIDVSVPLSVSDLSVTPNPATLGQPVYLNATAAGGTGLYSYAWTFGDGGVGGNLSDIVHVYTTNGPFLAEVTVTDAVGATARDYVNVTIKVQALASFTEVSAGVPLTVHFIGQAEGGTPPYRFAWSFGDGSMSADQDPSHTFNGTGRFAITLTVLDSRDNISSTTFILDVGNPSASIAGLSWFDATGLAGSVAAVILVAWSVSIIRRRAHRTEGAEWIKELTYDDTKHGDLNQPR
jgi:PKD repeat protein